MKTTLNLIRFLFPNDTGVATYSLDNFFYKSYIDRGKQIIKIFILGYNFNIPNKFIQINNKITTMHIFFV